MEAGAGSSPVGDLRLARCRFDSDLVRGFIAPYLLGYPSGYKGAVGMESNLQKTASGDVAGNS